MCDRCRSFVTGLALGSIRLVLNAAGESVQKEICPACIQEIYELVTTKVDDRKGHGFDEAFTLPKETTASASAEDIVAELLKRLKETPQGSLPSGTENS